MLNVGGLGMEVSEAYYLLILSILFLALSKINAWELHFILFYSLWIIYWIDIFIGNK